MIKKGNVKVIQTKDLGGNTNGCVIELEKDGKLTTRYASVANPGCFKGYHAHKVREANYVCVHGTILVETVELVNDEPVVTRTKLEVGDTLHIPINIPTALWNHTGEKAIIVNTPHPPYDPDLTDEQIDLTLAAAKKWVKNVQKD